MKIAKLCINTWAYASRDKRELAACQELGAEVEVFAKGEHTGTEEVVDGFPVTRISTRPLGEKVPNGLNRVVSLFTWASYMRKQNDIDVISAYDLIALSSLGCPISVSGTRPNWSMILMSLNWAAPDSAAQ